MRALERVGVSPTIQKLAAAPLHERQKGVPARWACLPVAGDVVTAERQVPTREGAVTVRTYRATDAESDLPVVLYFHGGAWMMGGLGGAEPFCRRLALQADVAVVSVDYRLAPEHPFPAGLNDCADVLTWVRGAGDLGWDPRRVAVAGDSAGGNLAAALTLVDRDAESPLRAQVLIYPSLDLTMSSEFFTGFRGPGLTQDQCREIVALYLGVGGEPANPLASPLHAEDLSELPPALVLTGGADILADDGHRYVERLLTSGTEARLEHYPRAPHAFLGFDRLLPEARLANDQIARFLRAKLRDDVRASP